MIAKWLLIFGAFLTFLRFSNALQTHFDSARMPAGMALLSVIALGSFLWISLLSYRSATGLSVIVGLIGIAGSYYLFGQSLSASAGGRLKVAFDARFTGNGAVKRHLFEDPAPNVFCLYLVLGSFRDWFLGLEIGRACHCSDSNICVSCDLRAEKAIGIPECQNLRKFDVEDWVVLAEAMVDNSVTAKVLRLATQMRVSIVETTDEYSRVAALRYACYILEGVIADHPEKKLFDEFDGKPAHPTFAISDDTGLVASIRVSILRHEQDSSPSVLSFPSEIAKLVAEGVVIDPNRFVIDRKASARYPELHLFVMTIPFALATAVRATYVLASVRPEHRAFYLRTMGAREIAPPRNYLGLTCDLGLMCGNFSTERGTLVHRNPFFTSWYDHTGLIETRFSSINPTS